MANVDTTTPMTRSGWVTFAGYMMVIGGIFQILAGLAALWQPDIYITTENNLFVMNYDQWGWTHLIVGLILAFSAASLFAGNTWGRFVAITAAILSAVVNFGFIWAYPVSSIAIIVIDVMIIYAVAMYGGHQETNA